jgi:hypothetical protein
MVGELNGSISIFFIGLDSMRILHIARRLTTMNDSRLLTFRSCILGIGMLLISGCDYRQKPSGGVEAQQTASRESLVREIGLPIREKPSAETPPTTPEPSRNSEIEPNRTKTSETLSNTPAIPPNPTQTAKPPQPPKTDLPKTDLGNVWIDPSSLPVLQWEITYLGNRPVGYTRRSIETASPKRLESIGVSNTSATTPLLCLEAESRIRISRKTSDAIDQTVFLRTIEKLDGELVGIEGNIDTGINKRKFVGVVRDGALNIQSTEDKVTSSNSVPWDPSYRGPFAIEQSLRKSPMKLKEIRVVRYLDPFQMAITESSLEGLTEGETVNFEGEFAIRLEIENRSTSQGRTTSSLIWTDGLGIVRKSYTASLDRQTYDCDPVTARLVISKEEFDATVFKDLPLLGSFAKLPDAGSGIFRIASEFLRSDGSISSKTNQNPQRVNEKTWDIQVNSITSEDLEDQTTDSPEHDALASTGLIDWKEHTIERWLSSQLDATALPTQESSSDISQQRRDRAGMARAWISTNVARTALDRNLQSATSTLRNRKGDSIDHAILLTAALRGLSIPARVAIGFRASPSGIRPTYQLHLWTEYNDSIRWIPIDSFLDTDTVPIDRIKITESTMPSINAYEPILTAIRLTADMELTARTRKP